MRALLISPETRTIEPVEVSGIDEIKALIGYETLESDAVGEAGDRLYFDEECFIRGTEGRFQIDSLIPVAGRGVVIGAGPDGEGLEDVQISAETLASRVKFQ